MESGLNEMGFRIYEKYVYEHVSSQQKNSSHGRIIYQSDGNSKTVDHAKVRDHTNSCATRILQFWSSQDIYDSWSKSS